MAQKFIINDGELILGDVELHENLIPDGRLRSKTVGGGRWYVDIETNTIYFYYKSIDFGYVTKEQFDSSIKEPWINDMNIIFSNREKLSDILKEQENNNLFDNL